MKRTLQQAVGLVVLIGLVGVIGSCSDNLVSPEAGKEEPDRPEASTDARLDLEVSELGSGTPSGGSATVRIRGVFRPGDEEVTVTGYTVVLRYEPGTLTPHASEEPDGEGLRVVNLHAGEGVVKAAGAAAAGFDDLVLFDLVMEVDEPGYRQGLSAELQELDVKEEDYADISGRVDVPAAVSDGEIGEPEENRADGPDEDSAGPGTPSTSAPDRAGPPSGRAGSGSGSGERDAP